MAALLNVRNMTHFFGGLRAVSDFNLTIEPGEIRGLIGPNGAGKTTVFNLITGVYTPTEGVVELEGANIKGLETHRIAAMGLGRTFQNLALWRHMNVIDHIRLAHYSQLSYGLFGAFFGTPACRREEQKVLDNSRKLMKIFDIEQFATHNIGNLPYGAQRRVEMARAMATNPKILFLDEPTAGMTPDELNRMINRAPDEVRHGSVRTHPDPGFRGSDRRRPAGRDPEQPRSHRGLPGQGGPALMHLVVENLSVSYGNIKALHGISFTVDQGEIVTIIGANGAGKSTTLRAISRMIPSEPGSKIEFEGQSILKYSTDKVVSKLGISHVPEGRMIFGNLTVTENLTLACFARKDSDAIERDRRWVFDLFPRLDERKNQLAGTLSGGEQQMLAVGRAYMSGRKIMILDEPSMGLAPLLMLDMFDALKEINAQGTTILLVEQNARLALKFAQRGYVLEHGQLILEGPAADLLDNPEVKKAYLGA